ncbi:hypothetical protein JTB14_037037 [Gonioctena quinquepunctata]|nr:hypothetical protein JTB14_037037 [Gonioctena quinquepunctata]
MQKNENSKSPIYQTWKTRNANWEVFQNIIENELPNFICSNDVNEIVSSFNNIILTAALTAIGKTKICQRSPVPWWNNEIHLARAASNRAFNVLKRHKSEENLLEFRKLRARTRYLMKKSKKNTWINYISTINESTPTETIWNKIRKLKVSNSPRNINTLVHNDILIASNEKIVETLADVDQHNSSDYLNPQLHRIQGIHRNHRYRHT